MKESLDHLPAEKQTELSRIVPIIREMCDDVEMIILFGSYARGDFREDHDLEPDRKSGAASDYDILVVCRHKSSVANHLLWDSISQQCNGLDPTVPFRLIIHDIKYVKDRLKKIHYFFSDIVKEGCLLYTSGKYELNVGKKLTLEQQIEVAQEHFDHWFEKAEVFFEDFQNNFSKASEARYCKHAAFNLHQAAESAYKALLLVLTNYTSHDHYLNSVDKQVREILPDMPEIFPCKTDTDKELFKHFDYAYIGARYDPDFQISKENLEYLSSRVNQLLEMTEKLSQEKIELLKNLAQTN